MMNLIAGRTRLFVAALALMLSAAACSTDGEADAEAEPGSAESSTTTKAEPTTTTTTTEATTTTLSDQAKAEAEIAQLVTDYWLTEIDTAEGILGLEYLTGLIETRTQEWAQGLTDAGRTLRDFEGQKRIEINRVQVDLEAGEAEVEACMGSGSEVLDIQTLEQIEIGANPDFLSTTTLFVVQTPAGWRIGDMFPTAATGSPELCEIES